MNCPFCNSVVKPSAGLQGVYQHAENVDTCIIGDLGIKDLAAWNRRASPTPEGGGGEELERAGDLIDAFENAVINCALLHGNNEPPKQEARRHLLAALLSSPRVEEVRREALEEAAKVAERGCLTHPDGGSPTEPERELCEAIAADIRALSLQVEGAKP